MEAKSISSRTPRIGPTAHRRRWMRLAAGVATLVWAGLWTAFVMADGLTDATTLGPTTYLYMSGFLIAFWTPTWLAWRRPLVGAVALGIVGTVAFVFFDYPGVRWILAAPPLVLAVAHAFVAWDERRGAASASTTEAGENGG